MSMISRIRNSIRRHAGAATLTTLLGTVAVGGIARNASAQTAPPTPQIITVLGSGNGLNGTKWIGELLLGNPNAQDAHGKIVFYNTSPGNDDTNPSTPYTVVKNGTLTLTDPIKAAGLSGNWAIKVIPSDVPVSATARMWNQQDHDGNPATVTELSQYQNARSMDDLLLDGDQATFVLPDTTPQQDGKAAFRANIHYYTEPLTAGELPQFRVTLFDRYGNYVNSTLVTGVDHGRGQVVNVVNTLFGIDPAPYDMIVVTPNNMTGYRCKLNIITTPVQNNEDLPGMDDGGAQEATVQKLVTDFSFQAAPGTVEANDPFAYRLHIKSAPGTTITGCTITAGIQGYVPGNGTNDFTWEQPSTATVAGSYPLSASCGVHDNDGDHSRTIAGNTLTVNPEANMHTVTIDATIRARMNQNLSAIASYLANNSYVPDIGDDSKAYLYSDVQWANMIAPRIDGNPSNNEITSVTFTRTPRAMVFNDWFPGNSLPVDGLDKQGQRTLYTLITGNSSW